MYHEHKHLRGFTHKQSKNAFKLQTDKVLVVWARLKTISPKDSNVFECLRDKLSFDNIKKEEQDYTDKNNGITKGHLNKKLEVSHSWRAYWL